MNVYNRHNDYSLGIYARHSNSLDQAKSLLDETIGDIGKVPADVVLAGSQREANFLLWQLDQLEKNHKAADNQLLEVECQVQTDLERLHLFGSHRISPADPVGAKLKDRLAMIKEKRQRAQKEFFDHQCLCMQKLVTLVNRQELLHQKR